MKKIKDYFIRLFGGHTSEELTTAYKNGRTDIIVQFHDYLKELNGLNADEWCHKVWTCVNNCRKSSEN